MVKILLSAGLILTLSTAVAMAVTVATVNGVEITVAEANSALKVISNNNMTWDRLNKDEKRQLIHMMAPSKLVLEASKKELSQKEKDIALSGFWMQREMSKMSISDKKAKVAYEKMKKAAKAIKSKEKMPPFDKAKQDIKIQLAQEQIVGNLIKKAEIKIK